MGGAGGRGGHLEVLQWARRERVPVGHVDVRGRCAAEAGHLEVLQWAHQNGCPWDEHTFMWAAMEGHLEVLQWARENGCPWNVECVLVGGGEATWRC